MAISKNKHVAIAFFLLVVRMFCSLVIELWN